MHRHDYAHGLELASWKWVVAVPSDDMAVWPTPLARGCAYGPTAQCITAPFLFLLLAQA